MSLYRYHSCSFPARVLTAAAILVLIQVCGMGVVARADEITIGVPEFPRDLNALSKESVVSALIRGAVTQSLVRLRHREEARVESAGSDANVAAQSDEAPSGDATVSVKRDVPTGNYPVPTGNHPVPTGNQMSGFDLDLSDSVQVSSDQRSWSFRLRRGRSFSSGAPISAADVLYSLDRCLKYSAMSEPGAGGPRISSESRNASSAAREDWVSIQAAPGDRSTAAQIAEKILEFVDSCPILERASSALFGSQLGIGGNLVGSGSYWIQHFDSGRAVVLQRSGVGTAAAERVTIRSFREGLHALTALRTGTVDVIFNTDPEVLARASKDQTLLISDCSGYKIVHRRGLNVQCEAPIAVPALRYIS